MQPFIVLKKDVRKLKGEASEEKDSLSESVDEEPPKRQRTSTSTPSSSFAPRRKKSSKKQFNVALPDPVQMNLLQIDDHFIQRKAETSRFLKTPASLYESALQIALKRSLSKKAR